MPSGLRWGILSTAKIGHKIIKGIGLSRNSCVHAVASREWTRALEIAKEYGIPRMFGSYEELLVSKEIDVIYIPLPNALHYEWTIKALEAGYPVLCEKPLASNAEEAQKMLEASKRTGVLLAEAFMYRYHPIYAVIKEIIEGGKIGDLLSIRSEFSYHMADRSNIRASAELAGGALMDIGCYCVSMSRLITNCEPDKVSAFERRTTVDDTLLGMMQFPNGVISQFECSFEKPFNSFAEISGTKGTIRINNFFRPENDGSLEIIIDGNHKTIQMPEAHCYQLEIEDFVNACKKGTSTRWCIEDAVANMKVIDALYESAKTGSIVSV